MRSATDGAPSFVFVPGLAAAGDELVFDGDEAHYLRRVVRVRAGESVTASDGDGTLADLVMLEAGPVVRAEVHDLHRRDYLRNYLGELHHAITDGVPVKGYFLWSFMDNFEWTDGYTRRFGIVHVDYRTQRRTPKLSAHWYSSVIRENRLV